ncbi:MAG TPA: hypothetical protein VIM57_02980, partial [Luteolibacter sp.]
THDEADIEPEANPILRLVRRVIPITHDYRGQGFFVKEAPRRGEAARWMATPLFVVLVLVETTDLIFAVDSIPAIFAITADPFLVFTSNVFAILGLRSLYFALAGMIAKFRYLKPALSLVLMLVGVKMLAAKWLKLWLGDSFNLTVLGVILAILATGVITSLIVGKHDEEKAG